MNDNPIHTFVLFITGRIPDELALPASLRFFMVVLYWLLMLGTVLVIVTNWRRDPTQRSWHHIVVCATRLFMSGMWYLGSLWKLPWPVTPGFTDWLGQTAKYSAFPIHAAFMRFFLDRIALAQPPVSLLEIALAASLMLGFMVRLSGIVGALFIFNLLIGLYNAPTEWPWTYVGIVCAHVMFATAPAGRSLGLDNLIARRLVWSPEGESVPARAWRWACSVP
jgi:uncharacterized membrane protein YphA (DoxX/SURF4 family)